METYYHPHDLTRFADMGKGNPELWEKFMQYYSAVFADGNLDRAGKGPHRPGGGACGTMPVLH